MNKEELIIYLKNKRETLLGIKFRNIIHPILLKIMEKMRNYKLEPRLDTEKNL